MHAILSATSQYPGQLPAQPRFLGRTIDAHGHVGKFYNDQNGWQLDTYTLDSLSKVIPPQDNPDVEKILVSNLSCISNTQPGQNGLPTFLDEYQGNRELLFACQKNPRFFPLAVAQPRRDALKASGLSRLLAEYPTQFYGLKFHPDYMNLPADHPAYDAHLKLAEQYQLPCVIHAAPGLSDPTRIYALARRHPAVPIVLYHMNLAPNQQVSQLPLQEVQTRHLQNKLDKHCWDVREQWNRDGIAVVEQALMKKDANLYLEVSWTKPETIVDAIRRVGPSRVLWGSDVPFLEIRDGRNVPYQQRVQEVEAALKTAFGKQADDIIDQVFYRNSQRLFFENKLPHDTQPNGTQPTKNTSIMALNTTTPQLHPFVNTVKDWIEKRWLSLKAVLEKFLRAWKQVWNGV